MKIPSMIPLAFCALLAVPTMSHAAAAQNMGHSGGMAHGNVMKISPGESLDGVLSVMERQIVSAADAMPAEKYNFAPTNGEFKGVSTFGDQVRHLAQANYSFFRGWGVAGEMDPKALSGLKTKDELVTALKNSYTFAHAAVRSITPQNAWDAVPGGEAPNTTRASMAAFAMAHSMDHYGQLVEYLRDNGIIPPASRR